MESFLHPYWNTAIAVFLTIVIFSLLRKKKQSASNKNNGKALPIAPGAFPIIGHLHLFAGGSQLPHVTLGSLADKCGPIFGIRLGMHRSVVISSWEIAKECYTTHDAILTARPEFAGAKYLAYNYAMFAFSPPGPYWREIRKFVNLELLSARQVERFAHLRASEVETAVKGLCKLCQEEKGASDGTVLVEMNEWFHNMSLNIMVRIVARKRYDANTSSDDSVEMEKRRCLKALREFFQYLGLSVASDAFPFLERFDIGGQIKKMKTTAHDLDSIVSEWLQEHRRRKVSAAAGHEHDFMDAMISAVDGKKLGDYDDDTIIKATCLAIIAGGSDTTTVTLIWAISLLLNNPHVLKKAQEELDMVIGKERLVKESDIHKLVYLQCIVKETLRTYPPAPLLAPRQFTEDCNIGGYHIPKGTRLIPNAWKIQKDPKVWTDPLVFKPERFLSSDVDVIKGQHFELIPFGSGRRICPGAAFGVQAVHLALATFLQAFEISNPSSEKIDMSESFGLTNMKATPLKVLVKPRINVVL